MTPGFWMHETSGVLRPAVESYLKGADLTPEQIAALRAYCRQWIAAPWRGRDIDLLRVEIDTIKDRSSLSRWLNLADAAGIDPL